MENYSSVVCLFYYRTILSYHTFGLFNPSLLLQNVSSPTTKTMEKALSITSLKMAPYWSFPPVVRHQRPCQWCSGTAQTLRPAMWGAVACRRVGRSGWPKEWHRQTKATTLGEMARGRSCPAAPSLSVVSRDGRWLLRCWPLSVLLNFRIL